MITSNEIISKLRLILHPKEGGYFTETYRSEEIIPKESLPIRYNEKRTFSTAIYFLLTPDTFSEIHRIKSDEIFHFYVGDPVEMLHLFPDGKGRIVTHGQDILNGMQPQVIVPKEVWQGARLKDGGKFALMGTTVSPGFEYVDYETGDREKLIKSYPNYKDMIIKLTK